MRRARPPAWPCRAGLPTPDTIGPNFVPRGGIYKPRAAQRTAADVIELPEEAADSLDAALHRPEDDGYFKDFYGDAFDWDNEVVYDRLHAHWTTVYAPDFAKLTAN